MMKSSIAIIVACACFLGSLVLRVSVGHAPHDHYSLRKSNNIVKTNGLLGSNEVVSRSLGADEQESSDNIFRHYNDAQQVMDQRRETAANGTQYLNIQPSITACPCDGLTCQSQEKHVGESISICLTSNFLDISSVTDMTLHVGNLSYSPVVDGVLNDLTELSLQGRLAVVTSMTISALFDVHVANSSSDLVVDATVLFDPSGRRGLATSVGNSTTLDASRMLLVERVEENTVIVALVCLAGLITVVSSLLVKRGYLRCLLASRRQEQANKDDLSIEYSEM